MVNQLSFDFKNASNIQECKGAGANPFIFRLFRTPCPKNIKVVLGPYEELL